MEFYKKYYFFLLLLFSLFVYFEVLTGIIIFYKKAGFSIDSWTEYYLGSEIKLKYFPNSKDNFKERMTFEGRIKKNLNHAVSFGIIIFTMIHLVRSLNKKENRKKRIEIFSYLLLITGFIEIIIEFIVIYFSSLHLVIVRIIFLLFFVILIIIYNSLLIKILWEEWKFS